MNRTAFHSYNMRLRRREEAPITFEAYSQMVDSNYPKDVLGRLATHTAKSIARMEEIFGESIHTRKKECFRCGEKKLEKEFGFRKNLKKEWIIWGVCRVCESNRLKKYYKGEQDVHKN